MQLTVVSGLMGRLSWSGVPPSLTIFAFFLCRRRSWFFFMRAISSASLKFDQESRGAKRNDEIANLFLALLSLSMSPVGAKVSA